MPFKMGPHSSWYYPCEVVLLAPGISLQNKSLLGRNYESLLKVTGRDLTMPRLEEKKKIWRCDMYHLRLGYCENCAIPSPFFLCFNSEPKTDPKVIL
jgi:hypothetical protein